MFTPYLLLIPILVFLGYFAFQQRKIAEQAKSTSLEQAEKIKKLEHKQQALTQNINQDFDFITGNSLAMNKVLEAVDKVAKTDANVIILGENGTGKELIAKRIHQLSNRKDEVFMNQNVVPGAKSAGMSI